MTAATADRAYLVAGHSVPVRSCNLPQHRLKPVSAPTESTWTAATAGIGRTRLPVTASKPVTSAAATSHSAYSTGHSVPVRSCNLPQHLQRRLKPVSAPTESTW